MEHYQNPGAPYGAPQSPAGPTPPAMGGRSEKKKKTKGEAKPVTKRVVNAQVKLALVFAVLAGLIASYLLLGLGNPGTYVVVAKSPLAAGEVVDAAQLKAVPMAEDLIIDGSFQGTSEKAALELAKAEIEGKRAQYPLGANQQVVKDQFNVEIALAEPLKAGERLVSIQATVANAVAGSIVPGDRVDVLASTKEVSGVVLSDVPVVSVTVSENQFQAVADQQTGDAKDAKPQSLLPSTPVPGIYVVRVAAEDAARLVAADAGADMTLVYRPKDASGLTPSKPLTAAGVICAADENAKGCAGL